MFDKCSNPAATKISQKRAWATPQALIITVQNMHGPNLMPTVHAWANPHAWAIMIAALCMPALRWLHSSAINTFFLAACFHFHGSRCALRCTLFHGYRGKEPSFIDSKSQCRRTCWENRVCRKTLLLNIFETR